MKTFTLLVAFILFASLQFAVGSDIKKIIEEDRTYCESIEQNNNQWHTNEFVYPFPSCGGGGVIEYKNKNETIKIETDISMSNARLISRYYFRHNTLIGYHEIKTPYLWHPELESYDRSHFSDLASEKTIYFSKNKIIYRQQTDRNLADSNDDNLKEETSELIKEATALAALKSSK